MGYPSFGKGVYMSMGKSVTLHTMKEIPPPVKGVRIHGNTGARHSETGPATLGRLALVPRKRGITVPRKRITVPRKGGIRYSTNGYPFRGKEGLVPRKTGSSPADEGYPSLGKGYPSLGHRESSNERLRIPYGSGDVPIGNGV